MSFFAELLLAWHYFKPKRSAVSIITLISVIGVALGVCVLIVVIAVMTGFSDHLKNKLIETGSHGQLRRAIVTSAKHPDGVASFFTEEEAASAIAMLKAKGATEAIPLLRSPVLMQVGESFQPKFVLAFQEDSECSHFPVREAVERAEKMEKETAARFGLPPRDTGKYSLGPKEVMISNVLAEDYHLQVGSKIVLHTQSRLMGLFRKDEQGRYTLDSESEKYLPAEFTVSGIFTFDKYDFDKNIIFMNLLDADDICGLNWGDATHIYFWVKDPFHMKTFSEDVQRELANNPVYQTPDKRILYNTWEDMNRQFLDVLQVEKSMMFFLLIFIVLVAAFSITNTLITTVIQKTKEIGLLKAMGASSGAVMRIFVLQGAFVGILGVGFGVFLGWLVVFYRMNILYTMRAVTGMEIFPKQMYLFNELPAHIIWSDVLLISIISILLCTCGAIIPALRAAHLDPAKALRYE